MAAVRPAGPEPMMRTLWRRGSDMDEGFLTEPDRSVNHGPARPCVNHQPATVRLFTTEIFHREIGRSGVVRDFLGLRDERGARRLRSRLTASRWLEPKILARS